MKRAPSTGIAVAVAIVDIALIVATTGYAQTLADSGATEAPWWVGAGWLVSFFPSRYVLRLPAFNHPLGLGGPMDDYVWGGLALANGVLWGLLTYFGLRSLSQRPALQRAT